MLVMLVMLVVVVVSFLVLYRIIFLIRDSLCEKNDTPKIL
jgi:hypothetical protein